MPSTSPEESTSRSSGSRSRRVRPLLAASDGSECAAHATEFAAELAEALGAELIVAAVATAHGFTMFPWDTGAQEHPVPAAMAAEWAHSDVQRLSSLGIDVTEVVLEGHPADALIAEASRCSVGMIVVGRHGATHGASPRPGSVVDELARRSPCPLLVVP